MSDDFEEFRGHSAPQNHEQALRYATQELVQLQQHQKQHKFEQLDALRLQHEELYAQFQAQRELAQEQDEKFTEKVQNGRTTRFLGQHKTEQPLLPPKSAKELRIFQHVHKNNHDYDPNAPYVPQKRADKDEDETALIATMAEARSTGEVKLYYQRVVDLFHKSYPKIYVPELHLKIEPKQNRPFFQFSIGIECFLSPLLLGTTGRSLRKIFVQCTPDFIQSEQRLIDATDTFYHTPERLQFVLAKGLCESALNLNGGWNWLKINFWRYASTKKYNLLREQKEMKSDTMAAHLSPDIAIGGIEHAAKLNSYYEYFQHDIVDSDEAVSADVRLLNLLNVAETIHGIRKVDALRLACNNRVTLSGSSQNLVKTVQRILDSKMLRQHISLHYPKLPISTKDTKTKSAI